MTPLRDEVKELLRKQDWSEDLIEAVSEEDTQIMNTPFWLEAATAISEVSFFFEIGLHKITESYRWSGYSVNTDGVYCCDAHYPKFFKIRADHVMFGDAKHTDIPKMTKELTEFHEDYYDYVLKVQF